MKILYRLFGAIILAIALSIYVVSVPTSIIYWVITGYEYLHKDYYDWVETKLEWYDRKTGI